MLAAVRARIGLAILILIGTSARGAEKTLEQQVRGELEQQLDALVHVPPPKLELFYEPPPGFGYRVAEAQFILDDVKLVTPPLDELNAAGSHLLFAAKVPPGPHVIVSRVAFVPASARIFSYVAAYRWKVEATASFATPAGTDVQVRATPAAVKGSGTQKDSVKLTHALSAIVLPAATGPVDPSAAAEPPAPEPKLSLPPVEGPASSEAKTCTLHVTVTGSVATAQVRLWGEPGQPAVSVVAHEPGNITVAPGHHALEVLANGVLAQIRALDVADCHDSGVAFELVPAPKKPTVVARNGRLKLATPLRFAAKTAKLAKGSAAIIREIVDAVVRGNVPKLRIEAHTDNQGERDALQALSDERAAAVASALRAAGLDAARVDAAGFGASRPIAPNLTAHGRELNERVELIVGAAP